MGLGGMLTEGVGGRQRQILSGRERVRLVKDRGIEGKWAEGVGVMDCRVRRLENHALLQSFGSPNPLR